jgi:glucose-1-phosphate thymidylyltransferase
MEVAAPISKCVILARGLGKRMREADASANIDSAQSAVADAGVKAMVPVGRPFLDFLLAVVADAKFTHVCLVIGPEHGAIRDYYTRAQRPQRIQLSFAIQADPLGTANAVLAAEHFAGIDEFLVMNGDNYYPLGALQQVQQLGQPGAVLFHAGGLVQHSNIPQDRVHTFAYCMVDAQGYLGDIVEKPDLVDFDPTKLVSMNLWRFAPDIFSACRDVPISPRGEYELPLAVKLAIQRGAKLKTAVSFSGALDLARRSDIEAIADRLKHVEVAI